MEDNKPFQYEGKVYMCLNNVLYSFNVESMSWEMVPPIDNIFKGWQSVSIDSPTTGSSISWSSVDEHESQDKMESSICRWLIPGYVFGVLLAFLILAIALLSGCTAVHVANAAPEDKYLSIVCDRSDTNKILTDHIFIRTDSVSGFQRPVKLDSGALVFVFENALVADMNWSYYDKKIRKIKNNTIVIRSNDDTLIVLK